MRSVQRQAIYDKVVAIKEKQWLDYTHRTGNTHPEIKKMGCRHVLVICEEGSIFHYDSAFVLAYMDEYGTWWNIIFPEHHDAVVFEAGDADIRQFDKRIPFDKVRLPKKR